MTDIKIVLEDGTEYCGISFGYQGYAAGELVFSTNMTAYPEIITDPAFKGQILIMTYPLAGNYGVPCDLRENNLPKYFESDDIHVSALVVTDYTPNYSHWGACKSLGEWMKERRIPGIYGVDTRALTKRLREKGNMLGKIVNLNHDAPFYHPYNDNLAEMVSCKNIIEYGSGSHRILLVDCGVKYNIIRNLLDNDCTVIRVPWDYDFPVAEYDGLLISNGPGDPKKYNATIRNISKVLQGNQPIMGIGLGGLLMGLAAGADIYKLKYGHHSNNHPVKRIGSESAFITAQNHGFAIDTDTLPDEWEPYYVNLNDGANEGFRHKIQPFFSAQFHHEPSGAASDTKYMFGMFIDEVKKNRSIH